MLLSLVNEASRAAWQVCSFLGLCAASSAKQPGSEHPISAVHRKLLATQRDHAGHMLAMPHKQSAVTAAQQKVADDPSSTCQICEMAVTYARVCLEALQISHMVYTWEAIPL